MSDDLWDPANEEGLVFSGRHTDGTVTIAVHIRVRIPDELALRARHLIDAKGLQPDWGSEVAALLEVTDVLKQANWPSTGLVPTEIQLRAGTSGTGVAGDFFAP